MQLIESAEGLLPLANNPRNFGTSKRQTIRAYEFVRVDGVRRPSSCGCCALDLTVGSCMPDLRFDSGSRRTRCAWPIRASTAANSSSGPMSWLCAERNAATSRAKLGPVSLLAWRRRQRTSQSATKMPAGERRTIYQDRFEKEVLPAFSGGMTQDIEREVQHQSFQDAAITSRRIEFNISGCSIGTQCPHSGMMCGVPCKRFVDRFYAEGCLHRDRQSAMTEPDGAIPAGRTGRA